MTADPQVVAEALAAHLTDGLWDGACNDPCGFMGSGPEAMRAHVAAAVVAALANADTPGAVGADERAAAERLRDLTRRLGFGDNITEPQADNDTIVAWFEEQGRDASEWREHELWRGDCYAAGHPDDEDCAEHGPTCCNRPHASGADERAARTVGVVCTNCDADDLACSACGALNTLIARASGAGETGEFRQSSVAPSTAGENGLRARIEALADRYENASSASWSRPDVIAHNLRAALADTAGQAGGETDG